MTDKILKVFLRITFGAQNAIFSYLLPYPSYDGFTLMSLLLLLFSIFFKQETFRLSVNMSVDILVCKGRKQVNSLLESLFSRPFTVCILVFEYFAIHVV